MNKKTNQHPIAQAFVNVPIGSDEAYFHYVNSITFLSAQEEKELAMRYHRDGDLDAAKRLVISHLRFVVKLAQGFKGYGLALMDLVQEGNIGLMKAVKRFDPNLGVRLVSFAVHWIKAEMHEFIIKNWRIVKIATTKAQRKLFFNLRSMKNRLSFTKAEVSEVAATLNVSEADVWKMDARLHAHDLSLESNEEENDSSENYLITKALVDKTQDPAQNLEENNDSFQMNEKLQTAFDTLDERSRNIIQARWLSEKKQTLQTLAQQYDISLERIRQIEKKAFLQLRGLLQA